MNENQKYITTPGGNMQQCYRKTHWKSSGFGNLRNGSQKTELGRPHKGRNSWGGVGWGGVRVTAEKTAFWVPASQTLSIAPLTFLVCVQSNSYRLYWEWETYVRLFLTTSCFNSLFWICLASYFFLLPLNFPPTFYCSLTIFNYAVFSVDGKLSFSESGMFSEHIVGISWCYWKLQDNIVI